MSNHGNGPFDESAPEFQARNERLRESLETTRFRGATGDFPEGRLTPNDEGAIQFAIGDKAGKVVVDFGTPVHWLAMTPQQAADLASAIMKRARFVALRNGEAVSFVIG